MKNLFKHLPLAVVAFSVLLSGASHEALAIPNFSVSNLTGVTQGQINTLIQTVGLEGEHRAYRSADPLGFFIGLDIGVEATVVRLPQSFRSDLTTLSSQDSSAAPALVPIPKLNIHKGLPFGIDVGMSYLSWSNEIRLIGGDIQWSFWKAANFMDLAFRFSGTSEKMWYVNSTTWQPDLVASINLLLIEPYFGTGIQFWNGNIALPAGFTPPAGISASASGTDAHFFGGLPVKMGFIWLTPEVDYTTTSILSFGAKLSLNL